MSGLDELFAQHPLPWRADCALTEFEAYAAVRDANEGVVWEADDGTAQRAGRGTLGRSDILLAHAIAALPELLTSTKVLADELETWLTVFGDSRTVAHNRAANATTAGHAALDKAGVKEEEK